MALPSPLGLLSLTPSTTHGSETEGGILGLVAVLGFFAVLIALILVLSKRQRKAWLAIGEELGLVPERRGSGRPPLAGRHGPHHVRLVVHEPNRTRRGARSPSPSGLHVQFGGASIGTGTSHDRAQRSCVVMEVTTPSAPIGFELLVRPMGLGGKIATRLGTEDLEIGQPDFDRRFRVQSNDPVLARQTLTGEAGVRLLALQRFEELHVGGGTIRLRRNSGHVKRETTRQDYQAVLALADRFAPAAPRVDAPVPPAAPRAPPRPEPVPVLPR